jgi:hypothetical protein
VTVLAAPRLRLPRTLQWAFALALFTLGLLSIGHWPTEGHDFRIAVWNPGSLLYHGIDPYNVAKYQHTFAVTGWMPPYAPSHLWLGVLFGGLPAPVATALWFGLNAAILLALSAIAVRAASGRINAPAVVAVAALIMLSRPGRALMDLGQVSALYILATYLAWSQARRRPWLAAVALAITLSKPPFGLPLLALLLARRLVPVVTRGLVVFAALNIPMLAWLAVADGSPLTVLRNFGNNLRFSERNPLDAPGAVRRIDGISLVAREFHVQLGAVGEVVTFAVVLSAAAVTLALASREWKITSPILLVLGSATLLSIAHQDYDLLLLVWPLGALARLNIGRRLTLVRVCALPVLIVCFVPAQTVVRLFDLGADVGPISSLTAASVLLAFGGALATILREHHSSSPNVICEYRPDSSRAN